MAMLTSILLPRRLERGGVSWVTLLLLLALLGGTWAVVAWAPIYVVHYSVKQTVRDFMNQAIRNRNDEVLVRNLCSKLRVLDSTTVVTENGTTEAVPTVVVDPADVVWERDLDADPPTLHVAFEYAREVHYPFLESATQEWVGSIDITNDLTKADWGPGR